MAAVTESQPEICNPVEEFIRKDRMPHIWCPGCGIGTTVNCFVRAILENKLDTSKIAIVSGIGCTGRVAGYMNLDSFHTTHGRAVPFAVGLKLARPELTVVVYSGDGDLTAIGGNHLIHAARRNLDLKIICVNNFTYAMTGGQSGPTTPLETIGTTAPFGVFDQPFNLPYLAESSGAVYVARWTSYHVRQLTKSMKEALAKSGFSFIEVVNQCPTLYGRRNRRGDGLAEMEYYKAHSKIKHGADTKTVDIDLKGDIIVGKFIDNDRPSFIESMNEHYRHIFGKKYEPYTGV